MVNTFGCTVNADCDDVDNCTVDVCSGVNCANAPVDCDDGDPRTTNGCDPWTGVCDNAPISCVDADCCTDDTCDSVIGCGHTPIDREDADSCPADSCADAVCFKDPVRPSCGEMFCDPS